jgi:hypothetical protein
MMFPVILPTGRARLVTKPAAIGSLIDMATIGMVFVARRAALARGVPNATITLTGIWASAEAVQVDSTKNVVYKSYHEVSVALADHGPSLDSIEKLKRIDFKPPNRGSPSVLRAPNNNSF